MQPNESEFAEADPHQRTFVLVIIGVALLAIVFGPAAANWLVEQLLAPSSAGPGVQMERAFMVLRVVGTVAAALMLPFVWFFFWHGVAALRTRTWPPPGMPVPWRLRRRRGRYAVRMGAGCLVVASLFLLHAALYAYSGWFIRIRVR